MRNRLLKIKLKKDIYAHNEPINGSILFETYEPIKLFSLELSICSSKKFHYNGKETSDTKMTNIHKTLFCWEEKDILSSGRHIFPFEIYLNGRAKNSFSEKIYIENAVIAVELKNILRAVLKIRDSLKCEKIEQPIKIFHNEMLSKKIIQQMKIRSCFSLFSSQVFFIGKIDRNSVHSGEKVQIEFSMRTKMSITVRSVVLSLHKMIDVSVDGQSFSIRSSEMKKELPRNTFDGRVVKIILPKYLHSSSDHENLRIRYFFQIRIEMANLPPFELKIPINILNREKPAIESQSLYLLKGIKFPVSYINL